MKLTSLIKVICSLALLLSSLGSYASVSDRMQPRGHQPGLSRGADAAEVICSAFSLLEDAVVPETTVCASGAVYLTRTSDIFLPVCIARSAVSHIDISGHFKYFYSGQHTLLPTSTPLIISIRRLLI